MKQKIKQSLKFSLPPKIMKTIFSNLLVGKTGRKGQTGQTDLGIEASWRIELPNCIINRTISRLREKVMSSVPDNDNDAVLTVKKHLEGELPKGPKRN